MKETRFEHAIVFRQYDDVAGIILKSEIIGVSVATDNEYVVYIHLRNGSKVEHFVDADDPKGISDEILRIASEMSWY
ncbi:hypothetical protein D3C87_583630 [compost metagenome]